MPEGDREKNCKILLYVGTWTLTVRGSTSDSFLRAMELSPYIVNRFVENKDEKISSLFNTSLHTQAR